MMPSKEDLKLIEEFHELAKEHPHLEVCASCQARPKVFNTTAIFIPSKNWAAYHLVKGLRTAYFLCDLCARDFNRSNKIMENVENHLLREIVRETKLE